jgi:hypothetical protein
MTRSLSTLAVLAVVALGGLATLVATTPGADARTEDARTEDAQSDGRTPAERGPIVLELFTSQGCSSCPPADRLLTELAAEEAGEVLPLAFHVDYWNRLGWRDPFSSEAWSKRQRRYARELPGGRVYTPQLVVDGREHAVGSDRRAVARLLADARARSQEGSVELSARISGGELLTAVGATATAAADEPLDLLLAVVESGFETPVGSGENSGRRLREDFVVRRLERVGSVAPGGPMFTRELRVPLDSEWSTDQLAAVAFLQHPHRLTIHGAAGWGFEG